MNKFELESNIFDVIFQLELCLRVKNKTDYKVWLTTMDELNEDYNKMTGNYYIHPLKSLCYYEHLWSRF